uniref:Uncharacterized protein n=1 Tax=Rhizophora mucronata TaxID=61149 RepID=A0A2P2QFH8_RHIMU
MKMDSHSKNHQWKQSSFNQNNIKHQYSVHSLLPFYHSTS